jgi:hypothetical protein
MERIEHFYSMCLTKVDKQKVSTAHITEPWNKMSIYMTHISKQVEQSNPTSERPNKPSISTMNMHI